MREISGQARTVRELLKDQRYSVDYYQREYRWQLKQVTALLDDLVNQFFEYYFHLKIGFEAFLHFLIVVYELILIYLKAI